jgi:hypothetical protein
LGARRELDDLDFMISQGDKISKIALVAKPLRKHLHLLLPEQEYAAPVTFFPPNELDQARNWLTE